MGADEFERTKQLLEKWSLPVGEEREIKFEFCGDVFRFKARILSAAEIGKLKRMGLRPDGTIDYDAVEKANDEFIRKAIIEPKVDPEKLHDFLKDKILEELLKIHGYDERVLPELEKKLRKTGFGMI